MSVSTCILAATGGAFWLARTSHSDWPSCQTYDLRDDFPGFTFRNQSTVRSLGSTDCRPRAIGGFLLSHDGDLLAIEDPVDGAVRIFDLSRGDWLPLNKRIAGRPLAWSNDGGKLAVYNRQSAAGELLVLSVPAMRILARTPHRMNRQLFGRSGAYFAFTPDGSALRIGAASGAAYDVEELSIASNRRRTVIRRDFPHAAEFAASTLDSDFLLLNSGSGGEVTLWDVAKNEMVARLPPAKHLDEGIEVDWIGNDYRILRRGNILLHRHSFWNVRTGASTALPGQVLGCAADSRYVVSVHVARRQHRDWLDDALARFALYSRTNRLPFAKAPPIRQSFVVSLTDADSPGAPRLQSEAARVVATRDRYDGSVDQWALSGDGSTVAAIDALDRLFVWRLPNTNDF